MATGRQCVICTEAPSKELCVLRCGHVFHSVCVERWFDRTKACPSCRVSMQFDRPLKLFFDAEERLKKAMQSSGSSSSQLQSESDIVQLTKQILLQEHKDEIRRIRREIRKERDTLQTLRELENKAASSAAQMRNKLRETECTILRVEERDLPVVRKTLACLEKLQSNAAARVALVNLAERALTQLRIVEDALATTTDNNKQWAQIETNLGLLPSSQQYGWDERTKRRQRQENATIVRILRDWLEQRRVLVAKENKRHRQAYETEKEAALQPIEQLHAQKVRNDETILALKAEIQHLDETWMKQTQERDQLRAEVDECEKALLRLESASASSSSSSSLASSSSSASSSSHSVAAAAASLSVSFSPSLRSAPTTSRPGGGGGGGGGGGKTSGSSSYSGSDTNSARDVSPGAPARHPSARASVPFEFASASSAPASASLATGALLSSKKRSRDLMSSSGSRIAAVSDSAASAGARAAVFALASGSGNRFPLTSHAQLQRHLPGSIMRSSSTFGSNGEGCVRSDGWQPPPLPVLPAMDARRMFEEQRAAEQALAAVLEQRRRHADALKKQRQRAATAAATMAHQRTPFTSLQNNFRL